MLVLRGGAAILFGIVALAWPAMTLLLLVIFFASYAIVVGVVALIASLKARADQGWWLLLLLGVASLTVGSLPPSIRTSPLSFWF
jgi:uncharacterized membrane protein HdeD (DUF308 family)